MFFAEPSYFYLFLLLLPLAILLQWGHLRRRRKQRVFAEVALLKPLKPETSSMHRFFRNGLLLLSLSFLILAMARPQLRREKEVPKEKKGIECIFLLDISRSMLAEDQHPNRLEFAKLTIHRLINNLTSSKVGLVVFAGSAFTQLPLTSDLISARSFVSDCNPDMLSNQGTAIASALEIASQGFSNRREVGKAIVLFTDGEDHDGDAVDKAKELASEGIKTFPVAVGTEDGALIPTEEGYLKDGYGETVLSKANPILCQDIAKATHGIAFSSRNVASLSSHILDELEKLPKASMDGRLEEYDELYGEFLAVALILLVVAQFVTFRKNPLFRRLKLFDR